MSIGLPEGTVAVRPYSAGWPRLFRAELLRLRERIGGHVLDIQHIGSTSVPGLDAKPIIDIGVAVASFEEAYVCVKPLERLGYVYRGENGIPRRHFFSYGDPRRFNLHMNELGSEDWLKTIRFRDYLIQHSDAARDYADLKRQLAARFPTDFPAYHDGKNQLITEILRRAAIDP